VTSLFFSRNTRCEIRPVRLAIVTRLSPSWIRSCCCCCFPAPGRYCYNQPRGHTHYKTAELVITRSQISLTATVYQHQLSMLSLQGPCISNSWGLNGHTTQRTSPASMVYQLWMVSCYKHLTFLHTAVEELYF